MHRRDKVTRDRSFNHFNWIYYSPSSWNPQELVFLARSKPISFITKPLHNRLIVGLFCCQYLLKSKARISITIRILLSKERHSDKHLQSNLRFSHVTDVLGISHHPRSASQEQKGNVDHFSDCSLRRSDIKAAALWVWATYGVSFHYSVAVSFRGNASKRTFYSQSQQKYFEAS